MSGDFVHLNFQSEYSTLDSTCSLKKLINQCETKNLNSIALTDVCNVRGAIKFYKTCTQSDFPVKPLLGSKILMSEGESKYPLILLSKDNDGFQNLRKLSHDSQTEGFVGGKATTSLDTLKKYSKGLLCISNDLNGSVNKLLRRDKIQEGYQEAQKFKEIFGDDYYLEVQKNDQLDQDNVNRNVFKIAKKLGTEIVATNDVRYYEKDHYMSYLVLRANKKHVTINGKRFSELRTKERYLKTYDEMKLAFKDYPETIFSNTVKVAEKCNVSFEFGGMVLPHFELGEGYTDDWEYLKHLAFEGLKERGHYGKEDYMERLEEELFDVKMVFEVKQYNFARYFLMVWDYVNAAIDRGCRVGVGRGCFKPHSLVDCIDGPKRIDEIVVGDKVLSYDEKYHEVEDTLIYDADEDLYEIELEDGRVIECTDNHEIHVLRDGELVWVRADQLTLEDDIYDIREGL
jgi:DNA polymerase-3 subunit alpha